MKYLDLSNEIVDMWNVDAVIIVQVVGSVHGLIAKRFDQHLKGLTLDSWIKALMPVKACNNLTVVYFYVFKYILLFIFIMYFKMLWRCIFECKKDTYNKVI